MPSNPSSSRDAVEVGELRRMCEVLLAHIERLGVARVDVPWDYYWFAEKNELYDPARAPSELTLGQLSHDLERLRAIVSGESPPVATALVWLASLLRATGDHVKG